MAGISGVTTYGGLGLFLCLLGLACFLIIRDANCLITITKFNYKLIEPFNITAMVLGAAIFIAGFFDAANAINEMITYGVIAVYLVVAILLLWSAGIAAAEPCVAPLLGINIAFYYRNAFTAKDGHNIAVLFLDILAGVVSALVAVYFYKKE